MIKRFKKWLKEGTIMQSNESMLQDKIFGFLMFLLSIYCAWWVWDLIRIAELIDAGAK